MTGINSQKLFFFDKDCSKIKFVPNSLEHAYLSILNEDLNTAKIIFSNLDSPRARWGSVFTSILEGFMVNFPTYFEIRNFLEIDVDFLLKNNKINYVEQVLGALDIFAAINQECYKFIARVMLENNLNTAALKYMDKSKQIFYNDPELHFMYAKYYYEKKYLNDAYFYVCECLKMVPSYYPAEIMKEKIEELRF